MHLQMVWNIYIGCNSSTMSNPVLSEEIISLDGYLAVINVIIQPCFTQGEDSDGFGIEEETARESLRMSILGIKLRMLR